MLGAVLKGLPTVGDPGKLFGELLGALHLPARDRAVVERLIADLRALFKR